MISDRHPILVVNDNIARRKPLGYGMTVTIMPDEITRVVWDSVLIRFVGAEEFAALCL